MTKLSERIKSELAIYASSDENSYYYKFIEEVNEIIAKYPEHSVKIGLDYILKSWDCKPWGSINLDKENFDTAGKHKRAWYIQYNIRGVYNVLAYLVRPKRCYSQLNDKEVVETLYGPICPDCGEIIDQRVYISRGGIINGDYFHFCYLKHQTGSYSIKDPIKIPVSSIESKDDEKLILFVDHREPKLKALMEFYDVLIEHDYNIKYNIRTFKKLK